MDNKALFNISYGIFLLAKKDGEKLNGCITNTCMQVANNPTRIAMSVINNNLTCEMLKKSKVFALSILDKRVTFDTIKHFGLQSGRDVRVMVVPEKVSDEDAKVIASLIKGRIEDEVSIPGQIKISVIREMRAVEFAKK